ncbi:MAG: helix-turn-helix transcriptional regulator [Ferruginibacter sp.]|nr:helix-turn-helix transcriptional regulator [Ferruginibacter sp.]
MNNLRDKKVLIAFGNNLRKLRQAKKLSMEELSYEVDVDLSQIYRIEKGLVNPTLSTLNAIAKALEISLKDLFDY